MRWKSLLSLFACLFGAASAVPAKADDGYRQVHSFLAKEGYKPGTGGYLPINSPAVPQGSGASWALYGMLAQGGTMTPEVCDANGCHPTFPDCGRQGCGVIYKLAPPNAVDLRWEQTRIYVPADQTDAAYPVGTLAFDKSGSVYGTAIYSSQDTYLYRLSPPTAGGYFWTKTILHRFSGASPVGEPSPVVGADGGVYGSSQGEEFTPYPYGSIWRVLPPLAGSLAWRFDILHQFTATDGGNVTAPLTVAPDGRIFGAARTGIFQLTPPAAGQHSWSYQIIVAWSSSCSAATYVQDALVLDASGDLYGVSLNGGASDADCRGFGTVFQITPPGAGAKLGKFQVVYAFTGAADGYSPRGPLLIAPDRSLLGVTGYGTATANGEALQTGGTVFRLSPPSTTGQRAYAVLHAFSSNLTAPLGGLTINPAGELMGVTQGGGDERLGSVYKIILQK